MGKKYLKIVLLLALIVLSRPLFSFAGTSSTLKYQVFLTKLEFYNSTTGLWVTLYEGNSAALDIASASGSGQAVGNFLSGLSIPDGSYTKARATPSTTFVIRGSVVAADGWTYYTSALSGADGFGRTAPLADVTASNIADGRTILLAADVAPSDTIFDGGATLTVTGGMPDHKVRVYFDLSNALQFVGGQILPREPTVTISLE